MKLLYLWVYGWQKSEYQEFHFSDEYYFAFHYENKCLTCDRNNESPSKLYYSENVRLISYIVGDNGSGKTTLLDLLMRILPYEGGIAVYKNEPQFQVIYVLKDDISSDLHIYTTLDSIKLIRRGHIKIRNCSNSAILRMELNNRNFFSCEEMKKTAVIFHSNILDRNRYNVSKTYPGVQDISFNGLLKRDHEYRTTDLESNARTELRSFLDADMMRQIRFISENSNKRYGQWIPFPLPQKLKIHFKEEHSIFSSIYQYDNSKFHIENESQICNYDENIDLAITDIDLLRKILVRIYKDILKRYNKMYRDTSNPFQYLIYRGILMSYLRLIFPDEVGIGTTRKFQDRISRLRKFMSQNNDHGSDQFIENLMEAVNINFEEYKSETVKINKFVENLEIYRVKSQAGTFYFDTDSNEKAIIKFYELFRATSFGVDYLAFSWDGLSSGENNLINMYSRLYSLHEEMKKYNAIILMIDEADLSYHPKWQQMYMKSLVSFLNKFYSGYHIQIIVATHSPIMLSDALKGNVIFLDNALGEDLDNTFGANIYDLYRGGMFLKKNKYGVIGTYAAEKIDNVMDKLNRWEKTKKLEDLYEIKKLISCIGEPVIKRIMQDKLEVIEQAMTGNTQNNEELSVLIEKLNKLHPEELDKVMKGIHKK